MYDFFNKYFFKEHLIYLFSYTKNWCARSSARLQAGRLVAQSLPALSCLSCSNQKKFVKIKSNPILIEEEEQTQTSP